MNSTPDEQSFDIFIKADKHWSFKCKATGITRDETKKQYLKDNPECKDCNVCLHISRL